MQVNIPGVVAEVTEVFMQYERALGTNDLDTIDSLFWRSSLTLRYGPNGTLVGHEAISAFRAPEISRESTARSRVPSLRPSVMTSP